MEMLKLKNGAEEAEPLVLTTMMILRKLLADKPMVFFDLVLKCRNSSYTMGGSAAAQLQEAALIDHDESIHSSIKNIVLSAAVGSGLAMTIENPVEAKAGG